MQKLYYSISEISEEVDEEQHILRYWEKEFDVLNPRKNRAGNRIYSERDLNLIRYIKVLLRTKRMSMKEAKRLLDDKIRSVGGLDEFLIGDAVAAVAESKSAPSPISAIPADGKVRIEADDARHMKRLMEDLLEFLT